MSAGSDVRRDLARYLRSVADLYPGGLPVLAPPRARAAVTESVPVQWCRWGKPLQGVGFLALDEDWQVLEDGPFGGENGKLLRAIIKQGLKLDEGGVLVVGRFSGVQTAAVAEADLAEIFGDPELRYLFCMGKSAWDLAGRLKLGRERCRMVPGLSQVRTSVEDKKLLWKELQQVNR